jgi:hypothetical protein
MPCPDFPPACAVIGCLAMLESPLSGALLLAMRWTARTGRKGWATWLSAALQPSACHQLRLECLVEHATIGVEHGQPDTIAKHERLHAGEWRAV